MNFFLLDAKLNLKVDGLNENVMQANPIELTVQKSIEVFWSV